MNYRIKSCFAGGNEEFVLGGDEDGVIRYWDTESVSSPPFCLSFSSDCDCESAGELIDPGGLQTG